MDIRDLLITPVLIIVVYAIAFIIRPRVTDATTRVYFLPAITVKIIGALAVGIIYQFYYGGGDTFNYHTWGSRFVWEALMKSPLTGVELLFSEGEYTPRIFKYASRIAFFGDDSSYFIVRLAAIFDVFTFSTYSATAILFALTSFVGMWMLFIMFYEKYPHLHRWLAISCLFIPSVFFWGSGLLKDTVIMGCLGIATYEFNRLLLQRRFSVMHLLLLLISLYFIFAVKKFILQAFLPGVLLWVYMNYTMRLKSVVVKLMLFPLIMLFAAGSAYFSVVKIGEGDARYSVDKIAQTARMTAMDIRYWTGKDAGSGYTLGEMDGTFGGMVKLAPQAINVALFRPYLWEVKNPLMLLSAVESLMLLIFTIIIIFKSRLGIFAAITEPDVMFCLTFSIIYAFAVGASTFNFGTLARYKIPLLPFFAIALVLLYFSKSDKNVEVLEETEY
ncbi:hypothetical protein [Chryseolinea lacunae]|uniref:Glycosyltransferase RgtA/B/C/D-like domain-containing protein n=1 Tax=Chryseolinea lacunae TaxID=2801331 RepID=A0ABS1KT48_9BACT|nr:hypothetical protein [Chryseolinea lacunae]MBL0742442.1 hypothetical protein [Chryseolinea lacunae]